MSEKSNQVKQAFHESLNEHISDKPFMPFLFLGSGMSRRYLDLPDWRGLLEVFASETSKDFDYLCATYEDDLPKVASEIAEEFHEIWWTNPKYAALKEKYRGEISGKRGAIKAAVAEFIMERDQLVDGAPGVNDPNLSHELELLSTVVVDGVITTNYDRLPRQIFPTFKEFVGQDDLLLGDAQFVAEIYKIHGSVMEPRSMVLTGDDYDEFKSKNAYLAAKLLTIFAEHPVIFVGYSLNDKHLNEILDSIAGAVGEEKLRVLGRRIYFIEWNPVPESGPVMETASIERGGHRFPITRIETNDFVWVWEVLSSLERSFSAPLLRELKRNLYELVSSASSDARRETVVAIPLDSEDAKNQKVVFGIGEFKNVDTTQPITITPRILERKDLLADVLGTARMPISDENVLAYGIPKQVKPSKTQFLPVWKYLAGDNRVDIEKRTVDYDGLDRIIETLSTNKVILQEKNFDRLKRESGGDVPGVSKLMDAGYKPYFVTQSLLRLAREGVDPKEFRDAVVKSWDDHSAADQAKLAWAYDRMMYSPFLMKNGFTLKD